MREFVLKAIGLKVGQSEPIGEKDRARLNLDARGTQVEFLGADGKPLGGLTAGKKYFKSEPENPDKAIRRRPLRRAAGRRQAASTWSADPLAQATTKSADWIDRTSFQVEKVKILEVRYPEGDGLAHRALAATTPTGSWPAPSRDEKLEVIKGERSLVLALADRARRRRAQGRNGSPAWTSRRSSPRRRSEDASTR